MQDVPVGSFFAFIFLPLFSLVVLHLMWLMMRNFSSALTSPKWPTVEGIVVDTILREDRVYGSGTVCFYNMKYKYSVNGLSYSGNKENIFKTFKEAQKETEQHPVNGKIVVYFNPRNNKISVLQTGIVWNDFFGYILIIFIGILYHVVMYGFFKKLLVSL